MTQDQEHHIATVVNALRGMWKDDYGPVIETFAAEVGISLEQALLFSVVHELGVSREMWERSSRRMEPVYEWMEKEAKKAKEEDDYIGG